MTKENNDNDQQYMWRGSHDPSLGVVSIWPQVFISEEEVKSGKLADFFHKNFSIEIIPIGTVFTLPDKGDYSGETGGRSDFLFYVPHQFISRFAVPRFQLGIRWWEDVYFNEGEDIYPPKLLEAFPNPTEVGR